MKNCPKYLIPDKGCLPPVMTNKWRLMLPAPSRSFRLNLMLIQGAVADPGTHQGVGNLQTIKIFKPISLLKGIWEVVTAEFGVHNHN